MSADVTPADALRVASDLLLAAGQVAPEPIGMGLRLLAAAAGAIGAAVADDRTEAEAVASIRRIRRIDVAGQDAEADERIRRRREEETFETHAIDIEGDPLTVRAGSLISYEFVVDHEIARGGRRGLYSVVWSMPKGGPSGTLTPGKSVPAQHGMRFRAAITDGA